MSSPPNASVGAPQSRAQSRDFLFYKNGRAVGKAMMTIAPYVLGGLLLIAMGCALLAFARYHGRSK